jgi:hypothetical protein
MQNKPNFQKAKMNLSFYLARDYEQITMNNELEKQTQTKPILSRRSIGEGGFKPDLVKIGNHEDMFWIFCCKMGEIWLQYLQLSILRKRRQYRRVK